MQVELRHISKSFSGNLVINDVSLRIDAGQIHALVGENGAGKSTLMKILIGVENADNGEIGIDSVVKQWRHPIEARNAGIAMVYQELSLIPSLSVAENIFLGRLLRNKMRMVSWSQMKNRVKRIFEELGFPIAINKSVEELSMAEKQMVEIARALAQHAELIILDEPTSSLSEQDTHKLFTRMKTLSAKGVSIVFITHRLEEVFTAADHITILRDGQLIKSCPISELDMETVVRGMVGRELREQFPARIPTKDQTARPLVLNVENATRKNEFYNVNFSLRKGEILGFAGLVGAGRTELMEAIFGISQLEQGRIQINDEVVKINSPTVAVQAGIGLIADDRKLKGLVIDASVLFNLTMATQLKFAAKWGLRLKKLEKKAAQQLISKLRIRLASIHQHVFSLSGGNQQKVTIGKTLNTESTILIFDEPTRGIDVGAKREIYFLIRKLAEEGAAIILVSSELEELLGLSDRIIVMCQGRIAGELAIEYATQEKIMEMAVGLHESNERGFEV
ncbi:MAG: sugar ABC transporter ATP-binding protein [bacterium]